MVVFCGFRNRFWWFSAEWFRSAIRAGALLEIYVIIFCFVLLYWHILEWLLVQSIKTHFTVLYVRNK